MCFRLSSFIGLLYLTVVSYFDVSEERNVSIFKVTELVCVDAEVIRRKKICLPCRNISGNLDNHRYGGREERIEFCLCPAHKVRRAILKCKHRQAYMSARIEHNVAHSKYQTRVHHPTFLCGRVRTLQTFIFTKECRIEMADQFYFRFIRKSLTIAITSP